MEQNKKTETFPGIEIQMMKLLLKKPIEVWVVLNSRQGMVGGLTHRQLREATGLSGGNLNKVLRALLEAKLIEKRRVKKDPTKHMISMKGSSPCDSKVTHIGVKKYPCDQNVYRAINREKLLRFFMTDDELRLFQAIKTQEIHKGTMTSYKIKNKNININKENNDIKKASLTEPLGDSDTKTPLPSRSDKNSPDQEKTLPPSRSDNGVPAESDLGENKPIPTKTTREVDWWTPEAFRRLTRRRKYAEQEFAKMGAQELECMRRMWAGYYQDHALDPFIRTMAFCNEYSRQWAPYSSFPLTGPGGIFGKNFHDTRHWADFVLARQQADMCNAKYGDWCKAIFKHYDKDPLPGVSVILPRYLKTPKAAEIYQGWYLDRFSSSHRDLEQPVWKAEDYDPDCPVQHNYWSGLVSDIKDRLAKYRNEVPFRLFAGYVRDGRIPIQAIEKYAPDYLPNMKIELERLSHSFAL